MYSRSGKIIRKINRKGQGGEEYTFCSGITLDEENNEIFVNDHFIKRILVYDLEGNFKQSFKQKEDGGSRSYMNIFNYDKENLICYDELNQETGQPHQNIVQNMFCNRISEKVRKKFVW